MPGRRRSVVVRPHGRASGIRIARRTKRLPGAQTKREYSASCAHADQFDKIQLDQQAQSSPPEAPPDKGRVAPHPPSGSEDRAAHPASAGKDHCAPGARRQAAISARLMALCVQIFCRSPPELDARRPISSRCYARPCHAYQRPDGLGSHAGAKAPGQYGSGEIDAVTVVEVKVDALDRGWWSRCRRGG
jgi:hypothetical protein